MIENPKPSYPRELPPRASLPRHAAPEQLFRFDVLTEILKQNRDVEAAIIGAEWILLGPDDDEEDET